MMFKEKPAGFNKRFDIVGCFIEHDGKFLLLHRQAHKAFGDTWGLPAGKIDPGEERSQAVLREIAEETGIQLPESALEHYDSLYVQHGDLHIEWHMYSARLQDLPTVTISPTEHSEFAWVTPEESLDKNLIHDQPESIRLFYKLDIAA